jgi:hypothetical protein
MIENRVRRIVEFGLHPVFPFRSTPAILALITCKFTSSLGTLTFVARWEGDL